MALALLFVLFGSVLSLRHKAQDKLWNNDVILDEMDDYNGDYEAKLCVSGYLANSQDDSRCCSNKS